MNTHYLCLLLSSCLLPVRGYTGGDVVLIRHHLRNLLEGPGGVFAGVGAVGVAHLIAAFAGALRDLGCRVDDVAVERVLVLHEVCCRQTEFGAVAQVGGVLLVAAAGRRLQADIRAFDAILDALIHLHLAHRLLRRDAILRVHRILPACLIGLVCLTLLALLALLSGLARLILIGCVLLHTTPFTFSVSR